MPQLKTSDGQNCDVEEEILREREREEEGGSEGRHVIAERSQRQFALWQMEKREGEEEEERRAHHYT